MEESTSKIDQYLSGEMSSADKKLFEAEMNSNESLKEEVLLQIKVVAMLDESAWIETKGKVAELNKKKRGSSPAIQLLKIAAILVIVLLPTYYIIHRQYSDQNLYASCNTKYPDHITTMGSSDDEVISAMSLYNNEKYDEAAKAFIELRLAGDSTLIIYEAISLTQNGESSAAIGLLESYIKTEPENISTYQWQLVLSYLANNQGDEAHKLLQEFVKNNDGYQTERGIELLDDLNSFWR